MLAAPLFFILPFLFFLLSYFSLFFFNDTATTEIYTLSLHDALPIRLNRPSSPAIFSFSSTTSLKASATLPDRKSTRLNSSHITISYAVFCLKKKKQKKHIINTAKKQKNNLIKCKL